MPYGTPRDFHVGELRYVVTLATRLQVPDPSGTGIIESFITPMAVNASITPIGLQTFILGEQLENNPTHRIVFRWQDGLDYFDVILCQITRSDGTTRQALYRVFRVTEVDGRQRFTSVDAIEEKRAG
jgi:hypothetical protein